MKRQDGESSENFMGVREVCPDISGEKVMDSENRKLFHMRSIICDVLFLPTCQICAVIFLHSP